MKELIYKFFILSNVSSNTFRANKKVLKFHLKKKTCLCKTFKKHRFVHLSDYQQKEEKTCKIYY